jgi:uncharacterized SAM-binding protein YcdF (DUF218 family)
MGWFGLVVVVAVLVVTFLDGSSTGHLAVACGVLLFASIVVAVYIRPGVQLRDDHLLVRNALADQAVPWGAIEAVGVRHVLEVDAGDRVVRALAFGRTARQQRRHAKATVKSADAGSPDGVDYTDFVVGRIRNAAESHGALRVGAGTGEPVTTTWRWAEAGVMAALAVATVVLALLS